MATNKDLEKKKVEQQPGVNGTDQNTLKGVDDATINKMNSSFTASNDQQNAQIKANEGLGRVEDVTSKKNIVSKSVMNTLNSSFKKPTAVVQADAWINNQLGIIQSGKTSFSDQVKDMMAQIQGRDKFSYDVDNDPLFQQALASSMNSGKQAMQDTIGQASALTGGYGSSYATTAGNQAYNSFIEDAYDNLPQYYQMAMEAYQMEGDELYRQLGMLTDADDREYNRNITAYDATYAHRNQMYNEAYQLHRDAKTDAYNMANLQLNIHGQQVNDAMNYYNATSNYADTLYNREYNSWLDTVNQAFKNAEMLNSDYWSQTNFDEGVRQYEQNFAEQQRQFDDQMDYNYSALAQDQSQFEAKMKNDNYWKNTDLKWQTMLHDYEANKDNKEFAEQQRQFNYSIGDTNNDGVVSDEESIAFAQKNGNATPSYMGDILSEEKMRAAMNSTGVKNFKSGIETYDEVMEGSSTPGRSFYADVGGTRQKFESYDDYLNAYAKKAYENGDLTEDEAKYIKMLINSGHFESVEFSSSRAEAEREKDKKWFW